MAQLNRKREEFNKSQAQKQPSNQVEMLLSERNEGVFNLFVSKLQASTDCRNENTKSTMND